MTDWSVRHRMPPTRCGAPSPGPSSPAGRDRFHSGQRGGVSTRRTPPRVSSDVNDRRVVRGDGRGPGSVRTATTGPSDGEPQVREERVVGVRKPVNPRSETESVGRSLCRGGRLSWGPTQIQGEPGCGGQGANEVKPVPAGQAAGAGAEGVVLRARPDSRTFRRISTGPTDRQFESDAAITPGLTCTAAGLALRGRPRRTNANRLSFWGA